MIAVVIILLLVATYFYCCNQRFYVAFRTVFVLITDSGTLKVTISTAVFPHRQALASARWITLIVLTKFFLIIPRAS